MEMPPKTDAFRSNVREFARLRGLTQRELAAKAGLSPEWLCTMLAGRSNPTLPVCERIASALGTSLESLVAMPEAKIPAIGPDSPDFASAALDRR
jgi:transcriptional regulator with XRE-family HTH domain